MRRYTDAERVELKRVADENSTPDEVDCSTSWYVKYYISYFKKGVHDGLFVQAKRDETWLRSLLDHHKRAYEEGYAFGYEQYEKGLGEYLAKLVKGTVNEKI